MKKGFDYIGIGTAALIHDGQGNILLQKRGSLARDEQGRWDICGGAIEFGDSFETTLRKELREELCTAPLDIEFLAVYDAHRIIEGKPTHWVAVTYAVRVDPETVRIGEPHKIAEIGWFNTHNLPVPRHSMFNRWYPLAVEKGIIK